MSKGIAKRSLFITAADYFVYRNFQYDQDLLYRSRILAGFSFVVIFLVTITGIFLSIIAAPLLGVGVKVGVMLTTLMSIIYSFNLWLLRRTGNFVLCANIVICTAWLALTSSVFVTGGPSVSTTTQIFVVTPLMAFAIAGKKSGMQWTGIVLITYLFIFILDRKGYDFSQVMRLEFLYIHCFVDWIISFFAIIGLVLVYESTNQRLRTERDNEHQQYVYLANHDTLTGLANRNYFNNSLAEALERAKRSGNQVALLYLDLDRFKPINDKFGHETGDRVLQVIAQRLRSCVRKTDLVARIGGDEFAIILEDVKDTIDFQDIAIKILSQIAAKIDCSHYDVNVAGSLGIALYPMHAKLIDELRVCADAAMYYSKNNSYHWSLYSDEMRV